MSRGKLILVEGLDRTGKSTQCAILCEKLGQLPNEVQLIKFPARETEIGQLINRYLVDKSFELPDQSIHLLFSANRWEMSNRIKSYLNEGRTVVLDRYVYSGVAYSMAKEVETMDLDWCLQPDKGLIKPDLTIFLTNDDSNADRGGFGEERYENVAFQEIVRGKFHEVFDRIDHSGIPDNGKLAIVNVTNQDIAQVTSKIMEHIEPLMREDLPLDGFPVF